MAPTSLKSVLYVDDDAHLRAIVSLVLTSVSKLAVRTCDSGASALHEVRNFAPDLLLLDVVMPEMDGPTLLAALRQQPNTEHTPVMFITATHQQQAQQFIDELGALGVISKPFAPLELATEVRRLWDSKPPLRRR